MVQTKKTTTKKVTPKPKVRKKIGQKLGSINGEPKYCGTHCEKCPILKGNKIIVINVVKDGKLTALRCKSKTK